MPRSTAKKKKKKLEKEGKKQTGQQQESEHADQVSGTSVAGRSQNDPCLGKKISLYLYLDKEESRVILDILVCQNISSIQLVASLLSPPPPTSCPSLSFSLVHITKVSTTTDLA